MPLPRLLDADALPPAELAAARLDGELYPLGSGWAPLDVVPTAADRLAGALSGLPGTWIAEQATALWVWGARADEPAIPELCVPLAERRAGPPGLVPREVTIPADEFAVLGGRRVTTPIRTAVDLARHRPAWTPELAAAVARLLRDSGATEEGVRAALAPSRRLGHRRRALQRLEECFAEPVSRC